MLIQQLILLPVNEGSIINEYSTVIIAIFTVLLVGITGYYAYLTGKLVKQTDDSLKQTEKIIEQNKNSYKQTEEIIKQNNDSHEQTDRTIEQGIVEKNIAYLEKRLEMLYYPLQDALKSDDIYVPHNYQDVMWAEYCGYDIGREPPRSMITNENTKRYSLDDVILYLYLASDKLRIPLDEFLGRIREFNPYEADNDESRAILHNLEEIIKDDISALEEKLKSLRQSYLAIKSK